MDDSAGVDEVRPPGLLLGVTPLPGATDGGLASVAKDVAALAAGFATVGLGADVRYVINAGTLAALSVAPLGSIGDRIIGSPLVPVGQVIAVDAAYFVSAFGAMEINVTHDATVTAADAGSAAPTQAMDNAGGLGTEHRVLPDKGIHIAGSTGAATVGAQAISLFQTWSLGIRLVMPAGYAVADGAVQMISDAVWVPAPA